MILGNARRIGCSWAALLLVPLSAVGSECLPAWSALAGPSGIGVSFYEINALTVFDDGTGPALYAGGGFTAFALPGGPLGAEARFVARWDGTDWAPLVGPNGIGVSDSVNALAVFDDGNGPALYAGGHFQMAGGVEVNHIARWDGTSWSPLATPEGIGVVTPVHALTVFDDGSGPALYAGRALGGSVDLRYAISRWDGSAWSAPVIPADDVAVFGSHVFALCGFDDGTGPALYAGGRFTYVGGFEEVEEVNNILRLKDGEWSALDGSSGRGVTSAFDVPSYTLSTVHALTVFDDGGGPALYVGGFFDTAGGVPIGSAVARWDGAEWSALSSPSGSGCGCGTVRSLTTFDDGTGPALYVGGTILTAGDETVNRIARWRGGEWASLSGPSAVGVTHWYDPMGLPFPPISIHALSVFDDGSGPDLYAGGFFWFAGGLETPNVARWTGCASLACPCDHDNDGVQSISDYYAFLSDFFSQLGGAGSADFDGSGEVTVEDFYAFLNCLPAIAESTTCP